MDGKLIIVTAPSGAGKTTIVKRIIAAFPALSFSISATTRPKRDHETEGVDYYFLSPDEFTERVQSGAFVEWEEVYPGKFYGTLKSECERLWHAGKHIIFDVDVKGALSLKNLFPERSLSLFIQPPSIEILRRRLENRKTETPETLATRIARAEMELQFGARFDRIIVNDNLETAVAEAVHAVDKFLLLS
ncbi:MAG: guanylate kinase [Chitinophagales bacterium]